MCDSALNGFAETGTIAFQVIDTAQFSAARRNAVLRAL